MLTYCKTASCGAACGQVLAVDGLDDNAALPYFLISHANLEAIEGAYAVMGLARAAKAGKDFETALKNAEATAITGRRLCQTFQRGQGWGAQDFPPIMPLTRKVLETGNPYLTIHDIENEGIETRFVVPAAFLCVKKGLEKGDDIRAGIETVMTEGLRIGGDPDTICSIALGLYGLFHPAMTCDMLGQITIGHSDE
jgi:ADP-ribosylglycohydrolase